MKSRMFAKTCLTVSLAGRSFGPAAHSPSPEQDKMPSPKEVEERPEPQSVAASEPQSPPLAEVKVKVRVEEARSVRRTQWEDPRTAETRSRELSGTKKSGSCAGYGIQTSFRALRSNLSGSWAEKTRYRG